MRSHIPRPSLGARRFIVIAADILVIIAAFYAAFLIRFEFALDPATMDIFWSTFWKPLPCYLVSAYVFSMYRGMFHYASYTDMINIVKACASGAVLTAFLILFMRQGRFPRSVLVLHTLFTFMGIAGIRMVIRMARNYVRYSGIAIGEPRNILLFGAGDLGEGLVRQIEKTPGMNYRVVGFIDDDPAKWGMQIHGHTVLAGREELANLVKKHEVDEVIIAISSQRGELVSSIMDSLKGISPQPELKVAPSLEEMLQKPGEGITVRKVNPADLLNREVKKLDEARISHIIEGKCVLVTGAGGTIGLELCRQTLKYGPARLVLLESHANSLFYCEREMKQKARGAKIQAVLGDVRDRALLERVFADNKPNTVLHAAAHKHVFQLEFNVQEGLANNVIGTYETARAADKFGAEVFLLVSTDKAVRPSSVMGATKRAAEMVVQGFAKKSKTRYTGVRFGNVLGSSGSVLQIFQQQIAMGGPVTLTDERVTRYFMTVEEAVGLILQAAAMAKGGEIYVLKMGTPVRIADLAHNLIVLSGLEPGKDIEIRVTGLLQGEKLDEELVEEESEKKVASEHPDITVLKPDIEQLLDEAGLEAIRKVASGTDSPAAVAKLKELIPSFNPAEAHGK
jgi:FlaA1/EpsC-like NDP-sugar epimerase